MSQRVVYAENQVRFTVIILKVTDARSDSEACFRFIVNTENSEG